METKQSSFIIDTVYKGSTEYWMVSLNCSLDTDTTDIQLVKEETMAQFAAKLVLAIFVV